MKTANMVRALGLGAAAVALYFSDKSKRAASVEANRGNTLAAQSYDSASSNYALMGAMLLGVTIVKWKHPLGSR